jgi:Protein of unknown function (DUF3313)
LTVRTAIMADLAGRSSGLHWLAVLLTMVSLGACAQAPMTLGNSLSSYENLTPADGILTKALVRINKDEILASKTVRIVPTAFAQAASPALAPNQRALVANAVDRAICVGLSDRFDVVGPGASADLVVHVAVTQAAATDEIVAGASKVVSIVPAFLSVPVSIPRVPIGLGSLTLEAEALDRAGRQQAVMIWARGADSFTTSPRVSKAGDAYDLATKFGADVSELLVSGNAPFGKMPRAPSLQKINASLGGKPAQAACEMFGRDPGLAGAIAAGVGLPPEWSDDGAASTAGR